MKDENNLINYQLASFLSFYGMMDTVAPIMKIEQSYELLQKKMHEQMSHGFEVEDMTQEMAYAINDTVCLWRLEKMRGTMADTLFTPMEFANIGLSQSTGFTSNALNILEIGRLKLEKGLPYLSTPIDHDEGKMSGAYTNNEPCYQGITTFHITQDDYSSLYPNVIVNY